MKLLVSNRVETNYEIALLILFNGYEIDFSAKAKAAFQAGAIACVIYKTENTYINMWTHLETQNMCMLGD